MELNPRQLRFVDEYLKDLNGTQAAIRAGYATKGADVRASQLLALDKVRKLVDERMAKRTARTEITADKVLRLLWLRATADPRKLVEYRRCCCRHCFGEDHAYQWVDIIEFAAELERVNAHNAKANKNSQRPLPTDEGGYGYNPTIKPHPKCPRCFGEGFGDVKVNDTRDYDEEAAALYAGVKQTRDGLEIKMHDQDAAVDRLMRHLGLYKDRQELTGPDGAPLIPPGVIKLVAGPGNGTP